LLGVECFATCAVSGMVSSETDKRASDQLGLKGLSSSGRRLEANIRVPVAARCTIRSGWGHIGQGKPSVSVACSQ
jgi:hypothetical protein